MLEKLTNIRAIIATAGLTFFFRIVALATSFLSTIVITRLFGIKEYGNYSLVFTISQACGIIFTLGLPNTLIKIIGNHNVEYSSAKMLLKKGVFAALGFTLIPMLFFFLASRFLAVSVFGSEELIGYFLVVTLSLPLYVLHEIFLSFMIANRKFMQYNIFMFILPNFLLIALLYAFYFAGFKGYWSFLAFAISILLTVITEVFTIFRKDTPAGVSLFTTRALLKTASPLMFSGLLLYLLNWTDVIILGIMVDEAKLGVYNVAYKVGSVGFLVIVSVSLVITPQIARLFGEGRLEDLKKLIHNSTRLIAVLSIPIVFFLIFFRNFILSFFGPEAADGGYTLIIVALGVLFSAISGNGDQILNMTNNQAILRNITILSFFVNVALNLIFIPFYGIEGSAFASLLTNILLNVLCVYYIRKKLGFYTLF